MSGIRLVHMVKVENCQQRLTLQHSRNPYTTYRNPLLKSNPSHTGGRAPATLGVFGTVGDDGNDGDKPLQHLYLTIYVVAAFIVVVYAAVQFVKWKKRRDLPVPLNDDAGDDGLAKGVRFSHAHIREI